MNIQQFDAFLNSLEEIKNIGTNNMPELQFIRQEVKEARRLSQYGERRIALENLLDNLLETSIPLCKTTIDLAEEAFDTPLSTYEKKLLQLHRMRLFGAEEGSSSQSKTNEN